MGDLRCFDLHQPLTYGYKDLQATSHYHASETDDERINDSKVAIARLGLWWQVPCGTKPSRLFNCMPDSGVDLILPNSSMRYHARCSC